ncbi:type III restriction enzyme [Catalinimonas alkaloidigena]|uniref:Type III restriction enzyme n=1 Tax=Catalinimonas alkaloidigena TaxID=1075417 RepID=A0A1G9JB27_9BACT|nr:DEAD/DEAH box helicase family protein [Catalinimonas alkaloidigena]SDL34740.1 type III restriction enzyme [Catalinimonas alkaloidigena]
MTLHQHFSAAHPAAFYRQRVPLGLTQNLSAARPLRPYQQEALGRFREYWETRRDANAPTHLLFHMATGSGKTLLMAGLMLDLYAKGYRHVLFFVNSTNILEKTRENFLNPASSKYLFAARMTWQGAPLRVREVTTFERREEGEIQVLFTTIQGLHSRLQTPRENSLTLEDLADQPLVLLSDEAHHLNATTKRKKALSANERAELHSWESTVQRVFGAHADNVLLEFTATADLHHPDLAQKYQDKLLFDYPLRQFRQDGYSKEVKVLQTDAPPFERALQGIVLSQYRLKLFEQHGQSLKPVLLFKSRTIRESRAFFEEFTERMYHLTTADLENLLRGSVPAPLSEAFRFFETQHLPLHGLVEEVRNAFSPANLLVINSQSESETGQLAVNSLEDPANPYRAVFAVDKLNEGWDVLNLFDIVRLYDTRDARAGKPGRTTVAEAQLIGRGARYCPFPLQSDHPADRRKFDAQPDHPLRIGETLYYHSAYNPHYIRELHTALVALGMQPPDAQHLTLRPSAAFQASAAYRHGIWWHHPSGKTPRTAHTTLTAVLPTRPLRVAIRAGRHLVGEAFVQDTSTAEAPGKQEMETVERLTAWGEAIVRKALCQLPFYQFDRLQTWFPRLTSITEFIHAADYLSAVQVALPAPSHELSPAERLRVARTALERLQALISTEKRDILPLKPVPLRQHLAARRVTLEAPQRHAPPHSGYVFEEVWTTADRLPFLTAFDRHYATLSTCFEEVYALTPAWGERLFSPDGQVITPDLVLLLARQSTRYQVHCSFRTKTHNFPRETHVREGHTYVVEGIALETVAAWEAFLGALPEG